MIKITKLRFYCLLLVTAAMMLSGCNVSKPDSKIVAPTKTNTVEYAPEPTEIVISQERQDYNEDDFNYSFSYPKSLNFEKQAPYPGGSIKAVGFRVDGLTESQLASQDLSQSLKSNDLYCNLDESYGEAVCENKSVEKYINSIGVSGFKVNRVKTFYDEDSGDPIVLDDIVYAFPIKEKNKTVSSYKAIIFSIKYPNTVNLELLKQIADSVKIY